MKSAKEISGMWDLAIISSENGFLEGRIFFVSID
jgi:hypothetical protein